MFSAFINPYTLAAGGLLVATPIIIHLINRIRFRRVKWAAMEFLLKAQKRMRRRKILEQLILLFLRCLLVALVAMLFGRFVGCGDPGKDGSKETRPTTHVIVLDDTPSMADAWRREDGGGQTDAFAEAKRLVTEKLMPAAAEAQTQQTMQVIHLSDLEKGFPARTKQVDGKDAPRSPEEIREEGRVSAKSIEQLEGYLKTLQVSTVRRGLVAGMRKAKELLDQAPANDARVIHIISDMRAVDWSGEGPAIQELIREFKDNNVAVHFIDVANPARKSDRKTPPFSDNVSIVDFKPRNRVVSVNQQTELEIRVKNNGGTELKDVGVSFYMNGQGNIITSAQLPTLPAYQERTHTVTVTFPEIAANTYDDLKKQINDKRREQNKPEMNQEEERIWKGSLRFRIITAALSTPEPGGITTDNSRHTVVEVRPKLKVLFVDGRTVENGIDLRKVKEGDSYFLRALFETKSQDLGNIVISQTEYGKLDTMDLRPYSTVYLMNVPTLSKAAVDNIEKYVKEGGGGVGVFLGPNVKPDDYNTRLYNGGQGFFPMPLQPEPKELTLEQKLARELAFAKRVLLRQSSNRFHPAVRSIYLNERGEPTKAEEVEKYFNLPNIDAHWAPLSRRGAWRESVTELYCLQNEVSIALFEERADTLVNAIRAKTNEPKFQKVRTVLDALLPKIKETPKQQLPLSLLAKYLDDLLCDQINTGDESEAILRDFWSQPEMADTKRMAMDVRDEAKFGDPLYVVKQFGRGRVAVMTTDAGGTYGTASNKKMWNDWPSLGGVAGWVVIAGEMQKYLSGGGEEPNRSVGDRLFAEFDFPRYEPTVSANFITTSDPTKPNTERRLSLLPKELGKLAMDSPKVATDPADAPKRPFQLSYDNTRTPGVYMFTLQRKKEATKATETDSDGPDPFGDLDFVGAAFNVDAINEGDLRRANTDDIAAQTNRAPLYTYEELQALTDAMKQKPSDYSSRRWLYLLILLVLIAEQAWAVRTSYHTKPEDLEALAPSAAAAYAHHAMPTPASSAEPTEADAPAVAR